MPAASAEPLERVSPATVQPQSNGLPFDPTFESWKPISTTDRGDNHKFRIIAANDVAATGFLSKAN